MRYVFRIGFALALSLALMAGCSDENGEGGSGGTAGTGGVAGMGGEGGSGGSNSEAFPCTEQGIRDAIALGGGPHTFACDGPTTVVTEATIVMDNDVSLDGEGNLTVDGGQAHDVFSVRQGVVVVLNGFTVTNAGWDRGRDSGGDGIFNLGSLTVTDTTVSGNYNVGIQTRGILTMANSTVSHNNGVGILFDGTTGGSATIINSTVSGNVCEMDCTDDTAPVPFLWGGILAVGGEVTLTNCTLSGNDETVTGIAAGIMATETTVTLTNTLVDDSCSDYSGGLPVDITPLGYNIESPGDTCGFRPTLGDQARVTAEQLNLGPLQDNGGPTQTHALLTEPEVSVAIDRIPAEDCVNADGAPLTTDQRGEPRPAGTTDPKKCDVGAFEVQP